METALAADAMRHLDKAIRNFEENSVQGQGKRPHFEQPPSLCFYESREKYSNAAWNAGYELRESLIKVTD